jgi:hypothetical protein
MLDPTPRRNFEASATRRHFSVERWYRDAKLYTTLKGTSEIQRLVIGRALQSDANATRLTSGWPLRAERLFRPACGAFVRDTLLACPCRTPTPQAPAANTVTSNAMRPTRRHRITAQPR